MKSAQVGGLKPPVSPNHMEQDKDLGKARDLLPASQGHAGKHVHVARQAGKAGKDNGLRL